MLWVRRAAAPRWGALAARLSGALSLYLDRSEQLLCGGAHLREARRQVRERERERLARLHHVELQLRQELPAGVELVLAEKPRRLPERRRTFLHQLVPLQRPAEAGQG